MTRARGQTRRFFLWGVSIRNSLRSNNTPTNHTKKVAKNNRFVLGEHILYNNSAPIFNLRLRRRQNSCPKKILRLTRRQNSAPIFFTHTAKTKKRTPFLFTPSANLTSQQKRRLLTPQQKRRLRRRKVAASKPDVAASGTSASVAGYGNFDTNAAPAQQRSS